jgi:hypothetical protein
MLAAIFAFLRSSKATNLSLADASGSFNMFESDFIKNKLLIFINFFSYN